MHLLHFLLICFIIFLPSHAFAEEPLKTEIVEDTGATNFMLFQVVKDQFVFDNASIKSAHLLQDKKGKFIGLQIELKPFAAAELQKVTTMGIGKPANLVFDGKVLSTSMIQTALGNQLLISSLTKEQAQLFLKKITEIEKRRVAEQRIDQMPKEVMPSD